MKCRCKMVFTSSTRKPREARKTGLSSLQEYKIWAGLKSRCNPNSKSKAWAPYYIGKVKICERWKNSFSEFYGDMGPRPGRQYSVDRRDNSKGYCKHNCRWATRHEQSMNRRNSKKFGLPVGVSRTNSGKYSARIRILGRDLHLGTYWTKKEAIDDYEKFSKYFDSPVSDLL